MHTRGDDPEISARMGAAMPLILNFHGVGPALRAIGEHESRAWLAPEFFETILDVARGHPQVAFTVDDGNLSDFTHIAPALVKRGLCATFFVCSGRLEQSAFLNRDQLRALRSEGMMIGSHGVGHVAWRGLSPENLRAELETSRGVLEEACGGPIDEAACPFGAYDRKVLAAARRAGYRRLYTSDGGAYEPGNWVVPRVTVTRMMSLDDVSSLLGNDSKYLRKKMIQAKMLVKKLR